MRRIYFSLLAITLLSSLSMLAQENDKNKPKIEGSGNVVTKDIAVQPFDQMTVSGAFSVQLSQGNKEEVKIEADDNLQSYFEVKNEGSKLVISMKKDVNISTKKKMKVFITFRKLKEMDLKTVGDVSSDQTLSFDDLKIGNKSVGSVTLKLNAGKLTIDNKSVGDIKLSGKAENVTIRNKSVGSIKAADFVVQKMDIDNDGIGSAEVNAEKELKVKDSFLGKVTNKGAATASRANKVRI
ncbi:MAG: DUF2807 domain-containing protein [Chitinophagaceae bacterium]|nr:DUF2807 domain-containing protein [Chitinophagaceae bacterium]